MLIGELPADAVRRECREELGVTTRIENPEPFRIYDPAPDLTLHAWVVTEWSGEVTNLAPAEHDEIGWFGIDDLDQLDLAEESLKALLTEAVALVADRDLRRPVGPFDSRFDLRVLERPRPIRSADEERSCRVGGRDDLSGWRHWVWPSSTRMSLICLTQCSTLAEWQC